MPLPLTAKHWRASDETWCVRVEVPRFFTVEEAARALATVYADTYTLAQGGVSVNERTIQRGLNLAVHNPVLLEHSTPPDGLVRVYQQAIEAKREKLVRCVADAQGVLRSARWLKRPIGEATHIRVDEVSLFSESEAAQALALAYPEPIPRRVGKGTAEKGLHIAARDRLLRRRQVGPELQERVAFWAGLIVEIGMFPGQG